MRLNQNNGKQSTEFHIDVVASLFIPPQHTIKIGLDKCHNKLTLEAASLYNNNTLIWSSELRN